MARVLVAECKQEISSFNPALSDYRDFTITTGEAIITAQRGMPTEIGGALSVFAERAAVGADRIEVVPAYSARAITSGGILRAASWQRILREWRGAVRAAGPVDTVYLSLHGAMASEDDFDPEGALIIATREIVSEHVPIVASLDLHGIPTERMLANLAVMVPYHTYPHVDFFETGRRAARCVTRLIDGEPQPAVARIFLPALVRGDELITATGRYGQIIAEAAAIERSPGGWAAGVMIGNPFTDVPELGTHVLVATDDPDRSSREATRLAEWFWSEKELLQADLTPMDETVAIAQRRLQAGDGTVILTDAADATSSGASGDSLEIVRALLRDGYRGRVLAPVVDPAAVAAAQEAGVGSIVWTTAGGAVDPVRFRSIPITARVRSLSDGRFINESHGTVWNAGDTAVLELIQAPVTLVVMSRPVSLYDRSLFYANGQDPTRFDTVVVKSPHCQPHMFADWSAQVVNVDAPGATSANLPTLGHTICRRPMWPLDTNVNWEPTIEQFGQEE